MDSCSQKPEAKSEPHRGEKSVAFGVVRFGDRNITTIGVERNFGNKVKFSKDIVIITPFGSERIPIAREKRKNILNLRSPFLKLQNNKTNAIIAAKTAVY